MKTQNGVRSEAPHATETVPQSHWDWWGWIVFNATVFVAAACIMSVEILSTRLVARYLGSSLYTWTSAIGVVLAGISLGNYVGGRFADRFHPKRTLSLLFMISSLTCVTIPMMNNWIGTWGVLDTLAWPTRIFLHFVLAFLLPSTMLGTMSPVVAKMALNMGLNTGRTIGTIYAWGSIGSIVGTFVTGFFLVAWLGTERAILLVAGVLALVGIFYGYRSWVPYAWTGTYTVAMLCALGSWSWAQPFASVLGLRDTDADTIVFKADSQYQRVVVKKMGANQRKMVLDKLMHSQVNMADPLDLKYEYEAIYAEVIRKHHPTNDPITAMVIGGGGYVFPHYLEVAYPGSYIEVTEIDPVVTRAAFEAFGLPKESSIHSYDMDARNRVADLIREKRAGKPVPTFDYILGDAFSDFSVPYHLTTLEFNQLLNELLSNEGVYMLNLIDMLASGRFLGAVLNTCRQVFPHVYVFAAGETSERNTFIVINAKRSLNLEGIADSIRAKSHLPAVQLNEASLGRLAEINGDIVLTDDYAPVENLLTEVVHAYSRSNAEEKSFFAEIQLLFQRGDFDGVIERCRKVLERNPSANGVHFLLGSALVRQDKFDLAIKEYRAELQVDPSHMQSHIDLGRTLEKLGDINAAVQEYRSALKINPTDSGVRCDLADALLKLGKEAEAEKEYRETMRRSAHYVRAYTGLGNLLYKKGEMEASISVRQQALKLDPDNAVLHNDLGRALAASGDVTVAVDAFSRAIDLKPASANYRANLGFAFEQLGRELEAIVQYRESLRLNAKNLPVINALAKLLSTSSDDTVRDGNQAVYWAERLCDLIGQQHPEGLDTLASAYAEAGRFPEAVDTARRAINSAKKMKMEDLANGIRERLALYQAGQAYRNSP